MALVYVTDIEYQADIKVFAVIERYQAALCFFEVDRDYKANTEAKWFFEDKDYKATVKIYWVEYEYQADLKVFRVTQEHLAGWQKSHRLITRLGKYTY